MATNHKLVLRIPVGAKTRQWTVPYDLLKNSINGSRLVIRVPSNRLVRYRRIVFIRESAGLWCAHGFITQTVFDVFDCTTELSTKDLEQLLFILDTNTVIRTIPDRYKHEEQNLYRL